MSGLLPSQKNEVLELIKAFGLDPFNFKWKRYQTNSSSSRPQYVPFLVYADSPYYFRFQDSPGQYYATFSPGEFAVDESQDTSEPRHWLVTVKCFKRWLSYLKRELSQPDLWRSLSEFRITGYTPPDRMPGNDQLSSQQVDQVVAGINAINEYIRITLPLTAENDNFVREQLDYLIDGARRQGKRDWLHTSIGVLFSLAVALAMSPEQMTQIWKMLRDAVNGVLILLP